jgi:serine phosphatase RsbU (regulator of sigma subunit)
MGWLSSSKNSDIKSEPARAADAGAAGTPDEWREDAALAGEFQRAFFGRDYPLVPAVHVQGRLRLSFAHSYQPALAVGGDFFSIESVGPDAAGIFVADVMGHGTRSALITAILRTLLNELQPQGRHAAHFLRQINQRFCSMLRGLPFTFFASACYVVADTTGRVATYSTAGHPPPFFLHRHLGRVSQLDVPRPHGAALGVLPEDEYGGGTVRLQDGDGFVFFTDGVYEAMNSAGEEFGLARLVAVLQANVYQTGPALLASIRAAVSEFVGTAPLHDDICLVSVDVTASAAEAPAPRKSS